jgi:hypothetical protein
MPKFSQFFQDDTGALSSTRLVFILWSIGVFFTWLYVCIVTKSLVAIPQTVCELCLIFMAGKVSGAIAENVTSFTNQNVTPTVIQNNAQGAPVIPPVQQPQTIIVNQPPPQPNIPPGFQGVPPGFQR